MADGEPSDGTAVTVIESIETTEEEDPDGGVEVKVLDVPSVDPPVLTESPKQSLDDDEPMDTNVSTDQAEPAVHKAGELEDAVVGTDKRTDSESDEKATSVTGNTLEEDDVTATTDDEHEEDSGKQDESMDSASPVVKGVSPPVLDDEDTIDSGDAEGSSTARPSKDGEKEPRKSVDGEDNAEGDRAQKSSSKNEDDSSKDGEKKNDDDDGVQSTDGPSESPRSQRRSSEANKSFEGGSEHSKMRGRLQKELRKLGIETSEQDLEETKVDEEEKPAARPSRNAARVAARKITNVVAKANMGMETLVASDGEDYSGDGISTKLAAQKKPRKRLIYISGQKALINNDLVMDCTEEALAPCQIDCFRNSVHHYNTITSQIHQMQKRNMKVNYSNDPLTAQEYEIVMNINRKDDERYRLEGVTSKVCRGGWSLVTVQRLGSELLRPNIVMTQSAPFGDLADEGEDDMTQLEEEFAVHQLDTDPVPFLVKHKFLRSTVGTKNRHHVCECNADTRTKKAPVLDGYLWKCSKCDRTWNILRPEQTLFSWYAKIPLFKLLNVIKSWVLANSCEETASLTGVDTFIVRSIWRSIQELCHKDVVKRILPLGSNAEIVEVTAAHMDPFVVLAALDKKTNTFRAKVFPAVTTSEVDLAKAASSWIAKDAKITTKSTVMHNAFTNEKKYLKIPTLAETHTLDEFLLIHLSDHFGNFKLENSHLPILEGFLYELEWRKAFGRFGPRESFWRMIAQLLPTSQEGISFLSQVASQFVTPGGQIPLGVKQPLIERRSSDDNVSVVVDHEEEEAVVLENYYYARRDGERHVQKHKKYIRDGEMFFRCPVCKKVAKNNVSIMKHISMHLESNREFNPDVSYLTICRTCFRDFETPYDCQVHVQQVHLASPELERLCCKICSLGYKDEQQLVYHMKTTHTARDMPFVCKICHFRSSFKHHVLEHFREKHSGCNALQCPYCLDLYYCQARQVVTGVQGVTKFYSHLFKHMNNTPKTCGHCSLPFIKQKELRVHKTECHNKNNSGKGKMTGCGWSSEKPVIVHKPRKRPPATITTSEKKDETTKDTDPKVNWLTPSLRLPEDVEDYDCRECQKPITAEHFCRVLRCSECHFFTCCQSSFTGHMLKQHGQRGRAVPKTIPQAPLLDNKHNPEKFAGRCKKCNEKFESGNALVKHLVTACGVENGATIELGKRKAAIKHTQVKRRRGVTPEPERKFEDVVGEPFTEVFNTSSSNSVGTTPVKTSMPKGAGANRGPAPEIDRFLANLGLRNVSDKCSQFKVNYTGPKCVKQQWITMGLVQQELESSSESEDENEDPGKKEKREKFKKERAQGLLPKSADGSQAAVDEEVASPPSSSSSDTSVTDVDLD